MELKLTQSSLPTTILSSSSISLKHFSLLAQSKEGKLHEIQLLKPSLSLGSTSKKWNQVFTVRPVIHLSLDKTTGSLLVLVPLLAFCIRCVVTALQSRISANMRCRTENTSGKHQQMRWRTVLGDSRDPDAMNAESGPDSDFLVDIASKHFSEDQEQIHFEDLSHDYTKLEGDYQKFLSDCGMSKWGYFRGGSPK